VDYLPGFRAEIALGPFATSARLSASRLDLFGLRRNVFRQYFWVAVWHCARRLASVVHSVFGLAPRCTFARKARPLSGN
jgi:hypothetical protein